MTVLNSGKNFLRFFKSLVQFLALAKRFCGPFLQNLNPPAALYYRNKILSHIHIIAIVSNV
jgi:hypothetical protein